MTCYLLDVENIIIFLLEREHTTTVHKKRLETQKYCNICGGEEQNNKKKKTRTTLEIIIIINGIIPKTRL